MAGAGSDFCKMSFYCPLKIPAPLPPDELAETRQFDSSRAEFWLNEPPPWFRGMVFVSTVKLPAPFAFPFSMLKPSKTVVFASLTERATW